MPWLPPFTALAERLERPWACAAVTALLTAAALGATYVLTAVSGRPYFFPLFPAILAASLLCGARSGLATTALYATAASYWWLGQAGAFGLAHPGDAWRLGGLVTSAVLVSVVTGRVRALTMRERGLRLDAEREVAARAEAERALRDSEALYRTLTEAAPGQTWVATEDGRMEFANRRWQEYTGLTPEQLTSRGLGDAIHPEDLPELERRWREARLTGRPFEAEYRLRARDGSHRWFWARALGIPGRDGRPGRWVGTSIDVEERRRAEEAVRRAAARLAALQGLTAALSAARTPVDVAAVILEEGLMVADASIGVVCRRRPGGFTALRSDRPAGTAPEFLGDDARLPAVEVLRTGKPVWLGTPEAIRAAYPHLEAGRAARGDGAWACLPLAVDAELLGAIGFAFADPRAFDAAERGWLGSIADLSAQALDRARLLEREQEARRRAEEAEEEARRVSRLQEQLMGVVGHDLRTPLSSIVMATGMARRGPLSAAQASALDRIGRSAARMNEIIRDLLDIARARSGLGLSVVPRPVGVEDVCHTAIAELQQLHPGRLVRVAVEGDDRVEADPARLLQALSNLVGNALQHGGEEGEVSLRIEGGASEVTVSVHNLGPPIPDAVKEELFEPFHGGRGEAGSVGLGLFIVREIARAHGGRVEVRSDAAHGTTFSLVIPRGAGDAGLTSCPPPRPAAS